MSESTVIDHSFGECLEILGIEEFRERIFHSNSYGELFHLADYYHIAKMVDDGILEKESFSSWVKELVQFAEKEWKRPESIFQHVPRFINEEIRNKVINL